MDLIEVSGLSKRFGGITALSDARLSARAGEVHALLGENGAGKSHADPDPRRRHPPRRRRASCSTARPIARRAPTRPGAAGIAAVFQELSLIPDLSVEQNIWFRHAPRTRARHHRPPGAAPGHARALRPLRLPGAQPRPRGPPPYPRRATDRRDRQGPRQGAARADPRRGDLGTARPRGRVAARPHPQPRRRGPARHLHLAPHGRGARRRRPAHHLPQRRHRRRPRRHRGQRRHHRHRDDRPPPRPALPRARRHRHRPRRAPGPRLRQRPAARRRQLRSPRRRGARRRRAAGPRPARALPGAVRRRPRHRHASSSGASRRASPARARRSPAATASRWSPRTAAARACC